MISSFARPRMRTYPSGSTLARSPVRNHPSAKLSGRCLWPLPVAVEHVRAADEDLAVYRAASPPRAAAARRFPACARRRTGWRCSSASRSSRSARAPAGRRARRAPGEARREAPPSQRRTRRSRASSPTRGEEASRWYIVGTPKNSVASWSVAASSTASTSNRGTGQPRLPPAACRADPTPSPWMWNSGRASTSRSAAVQRQAIRTDSQPASRFACAQHRTLGRAGGPRRVADQRGVARAAPRRAQLARASGSSTSGPSTSTSGPAAAETHAARSGSSTSAAFGARVGHDVRDLALSVGGVHRHDDDPGAQRGDVGDHELERGAGAEQHPVPGLEPRGPEGARHAPGRFLELGRVSPSRDRVRSRTGAAGPSAQTLRPGCGQAAGLRGDRALGRACPAADGPPIRDGHGPALCHGGTPCAKSEWLVWSVSMQANERR